MLTAEKIALYKKHNGQTNLIGAADSQAIDELLLQLSIIHKGFAGQTLIDATEERLNKEADANAIKALKELATLI